MKSTEIKRKRMQRRIENRVSGMKSTERKRKRMQKRIENRAMDKLPVRSLQDMLANLGLERPIITENTGLFLEAMKYYGTRSIPGRRHNPVVRAFLRMVGYGRTDDLNWCAAFMATIASDCDMEYSDRPTARSWLKVGAEVNLASAEMGQVVVFWRGSRRGWKGHVGVFVKRNRTHIEVLGGNQGRKVCIKAYPIKRLLGIRDLKMMKPIVAGPEVIQEAKNIREKIIGGKITLQDIDAMREIVVAGGEITFS